MAIDKGRERIKRVLVAIGLLLVSTALAMAVWDPNNLLWARNGYGMAQVGAWTGLQAVWAYLVYWFFEFWGRTVLSSAMVVLQCWAIWRVYALD